MTDPAFPLQKAVYDALITGAVAPNNAVFHKVPAGTPLPYVVIGQDIILSDNESTGEFYECTSVVHAFAATLPELKQIAGKIMAALAKPLTVTGFTCAIGKHDSTTYRVDNEGNEQVPHVIMSFEYGLQAT